jgi:hypothetical protein
MAGTLIKPGDPDPHADPVYVLIAHAIELALNGYLRVQGFSTAMLARSYGHDLSKLYLGPEIWGWIRV